MQVDEFRGQDADLCSAPGDNSLLLFHRKPCELILNWCLLLIAMQLLPHVTIFDQFNLFCVGIQVVEFSFTAFGMKPQCLEH